MPVFWRPAQPKRATLAGPSAAAWGLGCGRSGVYVPLRSNRQPVRARIRANGAAKTQAWRPSMQGNPQVGRSASSAGLGLYWCASRGTTELPWAVTHLPPSPLCRPRPVSCRRSHPCSSRGNTHTPYRVIISVDVPAGVEGGVQASNGNGSSPAKTPG